MKKLLLSVAFLLALSISFTSCKNDKTADSAEEVVENTVDATEEALEDAGDAVEEAVEEAGEAIDDAVDATEEAAEDAKRRVNEGLAADAEATEEAMKHLAEKESVTVSFSYMALGKAVKGSKTFTGSQKEVESAVQKLTDSIKKIDPKVKITTDNN